MKTNFLEMNVEVININRSLISILPFFSKNFIVVKTINFWTFQFKCASHVYIRSGNLTSENDLLSNTYLVSQHAIFLHVAICEFNFLPTITGGFELKQTEPRCSCVIEVC